MESLTNPLAQDLNNILGQTKAVWDELRGKRIFITGGTGFFGCWMLESFTWAVDKFGLDTTAVVLTRDPDSFLKKAPHLGTHPSITLHEGDVRSFKFPSGRYSHIIHMATEASRKLNDENPLLMLDTIIKGTSHTLDFAVSSGATKLLLVSSGAVYGRQPSDITHISEDFIGAPDVTDPGSAYGEGKRLAEHLCVLYGRYGVESKIARGFAFVGPYLPLDTHFAIGNFIGDAIKGQSIEIKGDGTPYRSYLYASDAVIWLWTILCRGKAFHPYNVGSEDQLTIVEVAERLRDVVYQSGSIKITERAVLGKAPERYVPSTKRARVELGLCQSVDLFEAIRRTVIWYETRMSGSVG